MDALGIQGLLTIEAQKKVRSSGKGKYNVHFPAGHATFTCCSLFQWVIRVYECHLEISSVTTSALSKPKLAGRTGHFEDEILVFSRN